MVSPCRLCIYQLLANSTYTPRCIPKMGTYTCRNKGASILASNLQVSQVYYSYLLETLTLFLHADPHHQDLYKKHCKFLPVLNSGSNPGSYVHDQLPGTIWWIKMSKSMHAKSCCFPPVQTTRRTFSLQSTWCSLEALMMVSSLPGSPGEVYTTHARSVHAVSLANCRGESPDNGIPHEISSLSCDIQLYSY